MSNQTKAWEGQVAIITGAASGLGFALAKRLAGQGVHVAVFDVNPDAVEKAVAELGENATGFTVDVRHEDSVRPAVESVLAKNGKIDILVNCAGITGQTNIKSHEVPLEDFDRVIAINVRGCLVTSQAVLPHMLEAGYGRILHMASIAGKEGNAGMVSYSASKAAVIGMTKTQGKEYAQTGITVNCLAPAVIRTAMHDTMPEAQIKYMTDKIPMGRCGSLDEFAAMAEFIVSPEASFTTAFCFDLSGGRATY